MLVRVSACGVGVCIWFRGRANACVTVLVCLCVCVSVPVCLCGVCVAVSNYRLATLSSRLRHSVWGGRCLEEWTRIVTELSEIAPQLLADCWPLAGREVRLAEVLVAA